MRRGRGSRAGTSDQPGARGAGPAGIFYGKAKELAAHGDASVRAELAGRKDVQPEILYFLAEDSSEGVRRTIAENATTPGQAHPLLARDASVDVRAGSIQESVSAPDAETSVKARRSTSEALNILARDEITRVRQVLAETLKDVAQAPVDVINLLARDGDIGVAGPVLEHSPALSDDDLLQIIAEAPAEGGLAAISRRRGVGGQVSDAIVATDDVGAITELLANDSTQIREQTLDKLIDRAPDHESWHELLVKRPDLPGRGATRLARCVADSLLETLYRREDFDEDTLSVVKDEVHRRLDGTEPNGASGKGFNFLHEEAPVELAGRLDQAGRLDDEIIVKALQASDLLFVIATLATRSGLSEPVIKRVCASGSAKGVVSLAWKAGLPMAVAEQLQQRLGRVPRTEILTATGKDGYPLTDDEMLWQIEFFSRSADGKRS